MGSFKEYLQGYMSIAGNSTANNIGAPIFMQPVKKKFSFGGADYEFVIPGSQYRDIVDLISTVIVTAENGTTPTVDIDWQSANDPCSGYGNVNNAGGYAADATSIVVSNGANIGSGTVAIPILFAKFSATGSPRIMTAYEWAMITSISTNTLTVTRGVFGTTGIALDNNDFLFYSLSWAPVLDSSGNVIKNDNFDHDGATGTAPKVAQLSMSSEGLEHFPARAFRLNQAAPSSGGITYRADLTLVHRAA